MFSPFQKIIHLLSEHKKYSVLKYLSLECDWNYKFQIDVLLNLELGYNILLLSEDENLYSCMCPIQY